jgi:prepilin-type cleavage/methylation N-terminal domain protein
MKKNAFTLVELLAVIVILAVLLTIAVPAVSNYIVNSKKESYVVVMQEYLAAARNLILSEQVKAPLDKNEVTILSFDAIPLEKGTTTSPFGSEWVDSKSYVAVINSGTGEDPHYTYYITSQDQDGYALPMEEEGNFGREDIIKNAKNKMEVTVQSLCGARDGSQATLATIKGLEAVQAHQESGDYEDWNVTIYSGSRCGG